MGLQGPDELMGLVRDLPVAWALGAGLVVAWAWRCPQAGVAARSSSVSGAASSTAVNGIAMLSGTDLGLDAQEDRDNPPGDHQRSAQEVAEGDPGDVTALRGVLDQIAEQQRSGDSADGRPDGVEERDTQSLGSPSGRPRSRSGTPRWFQPRRRRR